MAKGMLVREYKVREKCGFIPLRLTKNFISFHNIVPGSKLQVYETADGKLIVECAKKGDA